MIGGGGPRWLKAGGLLGRLKEGIGGGRGGQPKLYSFERIGLGS